MAKPPQVKSVCIHGHFYQPPRENPWLEEIEREESAAPFHDWNERINAECYRANTAARIVDDRNRILNLHNNYGSLSFNFGPTLLRWIERHDPWVYSAVLAADRESALRSGGHGNAIAQVYNHIIMPLACRRDKVTQVHWGIRDFEWRFGRRPEGMWLPETAVDRETLAVMAEAGIKFTILSPFQAARWRFIGKGSTWQDARDGRIPTGRAYRYDCGGGRRLHVFFYDSSLARGIAFERLLEHSERLLAQIDAVYGARDKDTEEPWLVHTATDGESYGHHFRFGDMALAAAFEKMEQDPATRVMNYSTFLSSFPVRAEAEIVENTAWSCAHGLGRWQSDCGCHVGGEPEWNQQWRGPLREAMDYLRDRLAHHFERRMEPLCKDPWKARDEYVEVLLDPERNLESFIERHMRLGPDFSSIHPFLQLLEMQRFSMYMYTSCGWFFDEISSLESVLILRYAARALQLAAATGAPDFEPRFLTILEKARSNLPEFGNGANVYLKKVKPQIVEKNRVAASYAIQSLARSSQREFELYGFDILPQREEDLGSSPAPCLYGHVKVRAGRTLEEEDFTYTVLHFGSLDFRCAVKPYAGEDDFKSTLEALQAAVEEQNTVQIVRILDERFGATHFSLHDVFKDLRSSIALEISQKTLASYTGFQRSLYQIYRPLMGSLRQWGIRIPSDLRVTVRRVLSDEVKQLVDDILAHEQAASFGSEGWEATDFFYRAHVAHLQNLLHDAKSWGTSLHLENPSSHLGAATVNSMTTLEGTFSAAHAGRVMRLVNVCQVLGVTPEVWKMQTLYFDLVRKGLGSPKLFAGLLNARRFCAELDRYLGCRFADFLDTLPESLSMELVPVKQSTALLRVP